MLKLVPNKRKPGRPPDPMTIVFKWQPHTPEGEAVHAATFRSLVELGRQLRRERIAKEVTQ